MNKNQTFEGRYSLGKNGIAYIKNRDTGDVIEVPKHDGGTAMSRDIVLVEITDAKRNEGRVVEIVARAKTGFVGIIKAHGDHFNLHPDDFKIPEILIPNALADNPTVGEKVYAEIETYEPTLTGRIVKHLGKVGSNDALMNGIALEQGFDFSFSDEVEAEADALEKKGITNDERENRRDMRDTLTFTIDPADAKDFDDALSFKKLDDKTYEIGIHIADVAHYVTPGSALDNEAQKRTTSVYLVDRTIPMLPEALSNGLCSLRQDEEKLAFSAVFDIDIKTGEVKKEWYGRTLINSNKRFSYEEAQDIIDAKSGLYSHELLELNRLSKIYTKNRHDNGALNFETYEVKFILDDDGKPIDVKVKERIDTNKLIEEFMLLANNGVAKYMQDADFFVYRIHDKPETERVEKLQEFLKLLDIKTQLVDGIIPPKQLQQIIADAEGSEIYDTLQTAIVRSMQKAIYTTNNIGHFGLAFENYSHFTSPIRRYPDVLAHRLLEHKLKETSTEQDQSWHEKMCAHSSAKEQSAVTAERNSIKLKQVEYMAQKNPDDILNGIVTGTGKFGVFVAEVESRSEGMIRLGDLGNDFFKFNEKIGVVKGEKTGQMFKLGDKIKMKLKKVDLKKKLIDYKLFTPRNPGDNRKNSSQKQR
ncbi:MAG: ribonuclease R [Candidatus Pacebacteria bacterium]|nr:ribonuclease R [Candidatus Paceibacterota bacterium]